MEITEAAREKTLMQLARARKEEELKANAEAKDYVSIAVSLDSWQGTAKRHRRRQGELKEKENRKRQRKENTEEVVRWIVIIVLSIVGPYIIYTFFDIIFLIAITLIWWLFLSIIFGKW